LEKHLFVGTQDLCVQSNPAFHPAFHPDGNRLIGPGFVGLDAKILRPYKQMICAPKQNNLASLQTNDYRMTISPPQSSGHPLPDQSDPPHHRHRHCPCR
jgi:hypothetical protein